MLIFFFIACESTQTDRSSKRSRQDIEKEIEKEFVDPRPPMLAKADTPRRKASMQIVEQGRKFLTDENYNQAQKKFEDSINIDPTNGIAFFYLALTRYQFEEYSEALGILDKADGLLGYDENWVSQLESLRILITSEKEIEVKYEGVE